MTASDLQHGCRAEYGPLVLRIQTTASSNGFLIYVEDPRVEHRIVHEHAVQSTLDSAQQYASLEAGKYLSANQEPLPLDPEWRCS